MPNILAIESTGENCSVAVFKDEKLLGVLQSDEKHSSSATLHLLIRAILKQTAISINQLNAIALSAGPGSYTGLRIGSSSAKGLCVALEIPLIAIPTHETMLYNANVTGKTVLCTTDARRQDVFISEYRNRQLIGRVSVQDISAPDFEEKLRNKTIIGSGTAKIAGLYALQNTMVADNCLHASQLLEPSLNRFNQSLFTDIYNFEPAYEKEFYSTAKIL